MQTTLYCASALNGALRWIILVVMNTLEIKSRLHERIEHLSEAQLKKLDDLLAREFSQDKSESEPPKSESSAP